ncbi:MAG: FAD:protein FMN transferase [Armatimonadetes bacterium]|nr:FAD:protein FMN transferase [Armatimonadota bacterium]MDE2207984.1 FAD:protein FMN transferase [Armatimonadota bacterium]
MTFPLIRASTGAMAARFEVALTGGNAVRLEAAARQALQEAVRLDAMLSRYMPGSDVWDINARAAREPVRSDGRVLAFLQRCAALTCVTHGAFDITVGPLLDAWGITDGVGLQPEPADLDAALKITGMHLVEIDRSTRSVRFLREGVLLDTGAIGKGTAIDAIVESLSENGVDHALVESGTSSARCIGAPPGRAGWRIAIHEPLDEAGPGRLHELVLRDKALAVSTPCGKQVFVGGEWRGHVIDPRSGRPVHACLLAAAVGDSAELCDALSTALLVLGAPGLRELTAGGVLDGGLTIEVGDDGRHEVTRVGI